MNVCCYTKNRIFCTALWKKDGKGRRGERGNKWAKKKERGELGFG